jgi:O-antigen/teichoic acid export membrane protein
MFDRIRRLGSDTALYGISTILGRFLTFLLTPVYTHVLVPDDLGVAATVYAFIAFFNVLYGYGMEGAYMKYVSTLEIGDRRQNFTVPFLSVAATSILFSGLLVWQRGPAADLMRVPEPLQGIVLSAACILFFDALTVIPFASLRMQRRARTFVAIRLSGIVLNVGLNIVLVVLWRGGVEAIFLSGVISSAFTFALLLPHILHEIVLPVPSGLLGLLLRFGLPSVPAGLAAMMIQVINRPIMDRMMGKAAVGVFQANYRLGIVMMLLVSMFDFAWRPFFLSHAKDADARPMFARVMTYYVVVASVLFLTFSLFMHDLVTLPLFAGRSLIAPAYWEGLGLVPPVLLGYLFLGVYNNLLAGVYIEKRTSILPAVTIAGAVVNIAGTVLLIPPWGMMGAAVATFLAYAVMATLLFLFVRRFYPLPYEWGRMGKVALSAGFVFALFLAAGGGEGSVVVKGLLLLAFLGSLFVFRFFEPEELAILKRLFTRQTSSPAGPPRDEV